MYSWYYVYYHQPLRLDVFQPLPVPAVSIMCTMIVLTAGPDTGGGVVECGLEVSAVSELISLLEVTEVKMSGE